MFNNLTTDAGIPSDAFFRPEPSPQLLPSIQTFIESLPRRIGQSPPRLHPQTYSSTPNSTYTFTQLTASSEPDHSHLSIALEGHPDRSAQRATAPFEFVIPIRHRPIAMKTAQESLAFDDSFDEPPPLAPIPRKRVTPDVPKNSKRSAKRRYPPMTTASTATTSLTIIPSEEFIRAAIAFSASLAYPSPITATTFRSRYQVGAALTAKPKVIGTRLIALSLLMKQQFPPAKMMNDLPSPEREQMRSLFQNAAPVVRLVEVDQDFGMVTISIKEEFDKLIYAFVTGKLANPKAAGTKLWGSPEMRRNYWTQFYVASISPVGNPYRTEFASDEGTEVWRSFRVPPSLLKSPHIIKVLREEPEQFLSMVGNLYQNAVINFFSVTTPDETVIKYTFFEIKLFTTGAFVTSKKSFCEELEKEIQRNAETQFQALKVSKVALRLKSHFDYGASLIV